MTHSIMGLFLTLSIYDIRHNGTRHTSIDCCYTEHRYAECHDYLNVLLNVVMLNVIMLSVVILNVVMMGVVILNVIMLGVIILI
jgi:hypothetical protein